MSDLPFLPYARQLVDEEDVEAVVNVLRSDWLTTGPAVGRFEASLADTVGSAWAVAVSSGTAALHAACFAAGVGEGDEVVVPAMTFVATANCARYLGAEPVFADVDPVTGLIDVESAARRLTNATRALIPVHLNGALADLSGLAARIERQGATVIEDAAHGLGSARNGRRTGACAEGSTMAVFSFHPVKHITTGEGGAITGNDRGFEQRLRLFRDHGIERAPGGFADRSPGPWYYEQQVLGHNLRLTDIQAALGSSQLTKLSHFVDRRRKVASQYDGRLRELEGVVPVVSGEARKECAYHLYPVLIDFERFGRSRRDVMDALRARGIGTQVHYIPVPLHPYYRARGWDPDAFPGAMAYYSRVLSLPLFPAMQESDVDRVVGALESVLQARKSGGRT
jgi:UDP-4-amino-4,6-dideoxy-N-acetyl-beta-L-altrosamine transaminase